ncbi:hypothetical protein C9439_04030 [archaeon SCG-AAA382B04]|nr:hypothetical protein C9439_04030 [archaeon SCG-AAA382B04]
MRGIELVGILVGIYLLYKSFSLIRNKREDVLNFIIWIIVGFSLIIAGLFPQIFSYIMNLLGMERRAYTMFAIGIFTSYILLFWIFSKIKELKEEISELNEEISIKNSIEDNRE